MDTRRAEVLRLLDRYVVEIVETYDLCPWARSARERGEIAVEVLFGEPTLPDWLAAARAALGQPKTRVAMIVAPEFSGDLRAIRVRVAAALPEAGVADFHPDAAPDLASPARLVPHLRRAPDPLLQLVPLALLDSVRGAPPVADRARQAQLLTSDVAPARGDVADTIAAANHARVARDTEAFARALDDIARDRDASYARVGISASRRRR